MTPEWDRFVTAVKLNKGLKETNHEQLYAYLKQHEKHVAYDRQINDRFNPTTNDPLALVSHVQPHTQISHVQSHLHLAPSSSIQPLHVHPSLNPYSVENSQLDSGYTQTDQIIEHLSNQVALLAQQFRATLLQTNNQLRTSSNTHNQATVQDGRVVANTYDADVDDQPVQDLAQNDPNIFQVDDCDAFDSDVDDEPTAQTIFMANLSSAVSSLQQAGPSNASILSEVLNLENAIDHHEIPNEVQQS
ncbi:hypothetical protein Tco_0996755, partial [Tanacetum coccineum]